MADGSPAPAALDGQGNDEVVERLVAQLREQHAEIERLRLALAEAELTVAGIGTLIDPTDGSAFLEVAELLDETGRLDLERAKAALSNLAQQKAYLAAPAGPPRFYGRRP